MLRHPKALRLALGLALASFLILPLSATAGDKPKPGKGKGVTKVTICHKGKVTIRVGFPALKAHLRHGDKVGRCGVHPAPHTAMLTVIKHLVNDNGGTKNAGDFTLAINGVNAVGGNSFAGSESGVTKTITTFGAYTVTESDLAGYTLTGATSGCSGTIAAGDQKVCLLTNDDVAARLTVIKQVINDHGGTKTAAEFTITINGVTAASGNTFAGSAAGVTKTLLSVGAYSVTEAAETGYTLKSASADCAGTIALGQPQTCVLTNDDV